MSLIQSTPFPKSLESSSDAFIFKSFDPAQAEALWILIVSDRHSPERKHSWPGVGNLPLLRDYLKNCDIEHPLAEEVGYCLYFKNQLVGTFHLHSISWKNRRLEVGYWVHFEFEGQGLISKALLMLEKRLQSMGFHRVEIRCNPMNKKSCALAERNQYKLEGTLSDYELEDGKFLDKAVYAKLFHTL